VTKERSLSGVAHDIAHHAGSGFSCLMPHLAQALREASLKTTVVELLDEEPYPTRVAEVPPLRSALGGLQQTALGILKKYGFARSDVLSIKLHGTPAPWDDTGYLLHTRAVITSAKERRFDSGWLG
jgi:hypothetical protein